MRGIKKEKYIVVLVTAPSKKSAGLLAKRLVKERLAACVNLITGVNSIFCWNGKVENEKEVILVIKTRKSLFTRLEGAVRSLIPYELPEVIALPVEKGEARYLRWIKKVTAKTSSD